VSAIDRRKQADSFMAAILRLSGGAVQTAAVICAKSLPLCSSERW
jgi:hypothetical protein